MRAQFGTIGVVGAPSDPAVLLWTPTTIKGHGAGLKKGMVAGALLPVALDGPLGIVVAPAGAIIGGLIGGVVGAKAAPSETTVAEWDAALNAALDPLRAQETFRTRVVEVGRDHTRHEFVLVPNHAPPAEGAEVSSRALSSSGVDAVLEIRVVTVELAAAGEEAANLSIVVSARLIRADDGATLYEHPLNYRAEVRDFTEWVDHHAQAVRNELDRAYRSLAAKIVDELFTTLRPLPGGSKRS
jgi:hypothetical protein